MLLTGLLLGTTVVAAVTQNDLVGLRSDIQKIGGQLGQVIRDVADIRGWQLAFDETKKHTEYRLNELAKDQERYVIECRANHVIMAPALRITPELKADDDKVSKSQLAIGVVLIVSFLTYAGKGALALWTWVKSVKP